MTAAPDFVAKTDLSLLKVFGVPNIAKGGLGDVFRFIVENVGTVLLTNIRIAAEYANGRFDVDVDVDGAVEDANLLGKEAVDERWLEVRWIGINTPVGAASPDEGAFPFKPVGGPYGLAEDGSEMDVAAYLAVPNLAAGHYAVCESRVRVPAGAATVRQTALGMVVSFEGEVD